VLLRRRDDDVVVRAVARSQVVVRVVVRLHPRGVEGVAPVRQQDGGRQGRGDALRAQQNGGQACDQCKWEAAVLPAWDAVKPLWPAVNPALAT
jgi:hypothetical protein